MGTTPDALALLDQQEAPPVFPGSQNDILAQAMDPQQTPTIQPQPRFSGDGVLPPGALGEITPAGPGTSPKVARYDSHLQMIEDSIKQNKEQSQRLQVALNQMLQPDSLKSYMPPPTAANMLQDALYNFAQSNLTGGRHTPIQQQRFDNAVKMHHAKTQDLAQMLTAYKTESGNLMGAYNQARYMQQMSDKEEQEHNLETFKRDQMAQQLKIAEAKNAILSTGNELRAGNFKSEAAHRAMQDKLTQLQIDHPEYRSQTKLIADLAGNPDLTSDEGRQSYFDTLKKYTDIAKPYHTPASIQIGNMLQPEDADQLAYAYMTTGQFPTRNAALIPKVMASVRRIAGENGFQPSQVPAIAANYQSMKQGLGKLTSNIMAVEGYENTAERNLTAMENSLKGIVDTGSPLFNKPIREIQKQLTGDPKLTQFLAYRQVAIDEVNRVLQSATATGAPVSQRIQALHDTLLSPDATVEQLKAATAAFRLDMSNRKYSYRMTHKNALDQMKQFGQLGFDTSDLEKTATQLSSDKPSEPASPRRTPMPSIAPPKAPSKRRTYNPVTGELE